MQGFSTLWAVKHTAAALFKVCGFGLENIVQDQIISHKPAKPITQAHAYNPNSITQHPTASSQPPPGARPNRRGSQPLAQVFDSFALGQVCCVCCNVTHLPLMKEALSPASSSPNPINPAINPNLQIPSRTPEILSRLCQGRIRTKRSALARLQALSRLMFPT